MGLGLGGGADVSAIFCVLPPFRWALCTLLMFKPRPLLCQAGWAVMRAELATDFSKAVAELALSFDGAGGCTASELRPVPDCCRC